ncbi:OLC1v1004392C1 [Oldenlandia corymbosa var. corymbosa]|uniref:OLC1v1004392C1 n=1 Tax=Oldenlandia corymbosa var. corymbosa TaxID=529605 RepID=A0AAV1DC60_OLDCO|nr:OLC1v1004392C1 [Oldenlandia corymbosa var. corymbosa]
MASTPFAASIVSVLRDLELMQLRYFDIYRPYPWNYNPLRYLRCELKTLNAFVVLCAIKVVKQDANLASLLLRIEDTVTKYADLIHRLCLGRPNDLYHDTALQFLNDIKLLKNEMGEWYASVKDSLLQRLSISVQLITTDNISTILNSNLEILEIVYIRDVKEALIEQMRFLQTLICFVKKPGNDLLVHVTLVAIAIHLIVVNPRALDDLAFLDELARERLEPFFSSATPVDSKVCEMYTQALTNSKPSARELLATTHGLDMKDSFMTMKNFLDSLISSLWEMLGKKPCVIFTKDPVREFYEGLRSLRNILRQRDQPNNFEAEIKAMVCDAGVLFCLLYQKTTEERLARLQDLLEAINNFRAKVGERDHQLPLLSNSPKTTSHLGFVDLVLEKLMDLPTASSQFFQTIHEELVSIRSYLGDIVKLRCQKKELQALWDRAFDMVYRVDDLIDHLLVGDHPDSFPKSVDSIINEVRNIELEIKIKRLNFEGKLQDFDGQRATTRSHKPLPSKTTISTEGNEVVGFVEDATSIMDQLLGGSARVRIIAIVGMPGLGKTTLATKIFHDISVSYYFHVRAWCVVSQAMNKKKLLFEILNQIDPCNGWSVLDEQDLEETLWKRLKGKKYLILLDDVWDSEAWSSLKGSFPDDNVGSRILLTSRHHDVAPSEMMIHEKPHFLQPLNKMESFELLQKRLVPGNDGWTPVLTDLAMQIAAYCKGLPLTIVLVAGLMATREAEYWEKIRDDLNSGATSVTEHCKNTLELSYEYLPDHLRPCLLYFGSFSEDEEVLSQRLLYLWIAEGFIRKTDGKRPLDIAEDYLNGLVERSLITVARKRWDDGVKACRMHDLLRDFCFQKAREEHFLHVLKGYDELLAFNEPCNLQRLCIHSEPQHFKDSKLFCPRARSLLFKSEKFQRMSLRIYGFKLLRVLDLEKIVLEHGFPKEIELLVLLAFLSIQCNIDFIPSSIAKLSNLETFIFFNSHLTNPIFFPKTLWNLQKLKYVHMTSYGGVLPSEDLDSSTVLYELDRFYGAVFPDSGSMQMLIRKFPNIRWLKCQVFQDVDDPKVLGNISFHFLSQLEKLHLSTRSRSHPTTFELSLPTHLKKLKLWNFALTRRNFSSIGKLPNLQFLKLTNIDFEGDTFDMGEGEFPKLKSLKFYWPVNLVSWSACDDQFNCLQELILYGCEKLEEMPSSLESITTLEMIKVYVYGSPNVVQMVRRIKDELAGWGNSNLKLIIEQDGIASSQPVRGIPWSCLLP